MVDCLSDLFIHGLVVARLLNISEDSQRFWEFRTIHSAKEVRESWFLGALVVLALNIDALPATLMLIVKSAFGLEPAIGGGIGITYREEVPIPYRDYAALVGEVAHDLERVQLRRMVLEDGVRAVELVMQAKELSQ